RAAGARFMACLWSRRRQAVWRGSTWIMRLQGCPHSDRRAGAAMSSRRPRVLISGASVAGPVLAYWLHRFGFEPTVVELTPELRVGGGGHAVDLFGPAVDLVEWMG